MVERSKNAFLSPLTALSILSVPLFLCGEQSSNETTIKIPRFP
jgi:hypothetical protein